MKSSIKITGRLKRYIYLPMVLTVLLVLFNIFAYVRDITIGVMFSSFVIVYFLVLFLFYRQYKPQLAHELISFATQYGTVQKRLLNEFEIPYALLDYNAKIMWSNEQFQRVTGKDKDYHKSITTIFPMLTKEILQKTEPIDSMNMILEEKNYRVSMRRIFFSDITLGISSLK